MPNRNSQSRNSQNLPEAAWLINRKFEPNSQASMVEYLRWMRSPYANNSDNNNTKLYLLQLIEENLNNPSYGKQLERLTRRTEKIVNARNGLKVPCTAPWRIRVGGTQGPENMLLPAFDALGIPYIPSSTLRGIARATALRVFKVKFVKEIREKQSNLTRKEVSQEAQSLAEKKVNSYFGTLDTDKPGDKIGKVTFLDAYLLPNNSQSGGLEIDIANSIWTWKDEKLQYKPNPNLFLSLKEATFVIGIFPRVNDKQSQGICKEVMNYLMSGLKRGIGAQVNSGYGRLLQPSDLNAIKQSPFPQEFFRLKFALQGQEIHNVPKFFNLKKPYRENKKGQLVIDTQAESEVRPIAFKSMLRYWFRMIALGVLDVKTLQKWEGNLFGAIEPEKSYGWVQVQTIELCKDEQVGILSLSYSPQAPTKKQTKDAIKKLFTNLIWLMFRLGGVGQGARRPFHERTSNPWIRGSTLRPLSDDDFWKIRSDMEEFQDDFQQRLKDFYQALWTLKGKSKKHNFKLKSVGEVSEHQWTEAMDKNCQVWVVSGQKGIHKPYTLKVLHQQYHRLEDQKEYSKAKSLCGGTRTDYITDKNGDEHKREAIPSPIWVADLDKYQVVTVFGCCEGERNKYLNKLKEDSAHEKSLQIFPVPEDKK